MSDEIADMRELGAAAALLHDLGHGPFSHAYESIMQPVGFSHEEMTRRIISETEVGDLLDARGVASRDVCRVLEGGGGGGSGGSGGSGEHATLSRLISSQLDADRLDYLMRDSYFTGANYGKIDLLRIANTLELDGGADGADGGGSVVVAGKGIGAVEGYVVGRYLMYKNVYHHHTVRQMELMLEKAFRRAADIGPAETGLDALADPVAGLPDPAAFCRADDGAATALIGRWTRSGDGVLSDLSSHIMARKKFSWRRLPRALFDEVASDPSRMEALRRRFDKAGLPAEYYLVVDGEGGSGYTRYEPSGGGADILVRGAGGGEGLAEISSVSAVVGALVSRREEEDDTGLFYPPRMEEAVSEAFGPRRQQQ